MRILAVLFLLFYSLHSGFSQTANGNAILQQTIRNEADKTRRTIERENMLSRQQASKQQQQSGIAQAVTAQNQAKASLIQAQFLQEQNRELRNRVTELEQKIASIEAKKEKDLQAAQEAKRNAITIPEMWDKIAQAFPNTKIGSSLINRYAKEMENQLKLTNPEQLNNPQVLWEIYVEADKRTRQP